MPNNQPISTMPVYASDELVAIRARGDYINLSAQSEQLAFGNDGQITSGSPWTLTSASVDFNAQGVQPQNIVVLKGPNGAGMGTPRMFAVDGVSPNTLMLRMINQAPGIGQPPTLSGATSITFTINTFASLIEDASWDLKNRYALDEMIPFHSSPWLYVGLEAPFRDLRAACVLKVLIEAYSIEARTKDGDWPKKLTIFQREYQEVLERLQLRFGPFGTSQPPITSFSCGLSR